MIKTREMEKFISNLKKLYIQNPNLPITSDTIYHELANYDFSKKELEDNDIRYMFPELERLFANSNLQVYVSERQTRFLQFANNNGYTKCVKLYVSFPKKIIEQAAIKIFGFVSENNMITASKLADYIRSDSIVIRLADPEDAKKVINFINNDKELVKYHKQTNPFSLKEGIVGVGYDDLLSYNLTIAKIMVEYFQALRINNSLKQASLEQFGNYVANYYYQTFITKENLLNFLNSDVYKSSTGRFQTDGEAVNNYEQVMRLIALTLKNNLSLEQYFELFEKFCRENNTHYYTQELALLRHQASVKGNTEPLENREQLLNDYIKYAISKYGLDKASLYLKSYLSGNANSITRDDNFRNRFIAFLTPQIVLSMVGEDVKGYMIAVSGIENKEVANVNPTDNYAFFVEACQATLRKYNPEQLYNALNLALEGDFRGFTNGEANYRVYMNNNFDSQIIKNYLLFYLQEKNYTISFNMDMAKIFVDDLTNSELAKNTSKVV